MNETIKKEKREHVRALAAAYRDQFEKRYIKPYMIDKTATELVEPDWTRVDQENLTIQDQWLYYDFLGECYRHGMMDGEAMLYQNQHSIPARVFELR